MGLASAIDLKLPSRAHVCSTYYSSTLNCDQHTGSMFFLFSRCSQPLDTALGVQMCSLPHDISRFPTRVIQITTFQKIDWCVLQRGGVPISPGSWMIRELIIRLITFGLARTPHTLSAPDRPNTRGRIITAVGGRGRRRSSKLLPSVTGEAST